MIDDNTEGKARGTGRQDGVNIPSRIAIGIVIGIAMFGIGGWIISLLFM